jgi:AraC-like DNA-binding protein
MVFFWYSKKMAKPSVLTQTAHELAFGFALWRWDYISSMGRAHTHPDIELNWMPNTQLEYAIAGKHAVIEAGKLGIFWGGVPHQLLEVKPSKEGGIWLTVPLSWFLSCAFSNDFAARLMSGELVSASIESFRIEQWEKDFNAGPHTQRLLLLELEAMLERIALASLQPYQDPKPLGIQDDLNFIESITSFLATHYQEPLSIQRIADAMKLHPKYLMTAFKQACGITVQNYLLHLRLAHAQRLLSTTNLGVLDVAMDSGFGSLSQFYEHFSRQVGERPLSYRHRQARVKG